MKPSVKYLAIYRHKDRYSIVRMTIRQICNALTERGIPTTSGKEKWAVSTVKSILSNERYKGEALLQKKSTVDYLSKKMAKNEEQVPQYYVENSHPTIVSPEMFDLVQAEIAKNSVSPQHINNISCFSGRVACPFCEEVYGRKTWRTTVDGEPTSRQVWQCNGKYRERGKVCHSVHITEDELKWVFVEALNKILDDKERYIAALEPLINMLSDTITLESESEILRERLTGICTQLADLVADNARRFQDQSEHRTKHAEVSAKYENLKAKLETFENEIKSRKVQQENIRKFIETVRGRANLLLSFDEPLFRSTVDLITVYSKQEVAVKFRDGREVRINTALFDEEKPADKQGFH